ncbi:MAG: TIGR01212 family radical SAM protein [Syntrophomonadaceae bacterium]|nr:TIGR01212 family radical SAM protein [Syntrophomonadaceae bacterium]
MDKEVRLWGNKRYHSLNYHLREKFGQKVLKISLDAGFTCPNRDGTLSTEGCYFCSARGSGDFAGDRRLSLEEQFVQVKRLMHKKWSRGLYIAYFQAFTNTYAPVPRLRQLYRQALGQPGVVGLAIATRPDCLPGEVLDLLAEINQHTYLWVELGLQSVHQKTCRLLNLHYDYEIFCQALNKLQERNIETCAHIILGLPGEDREEMLLTGRTVASLPIQGLKIHLLHLMRGTPLVKLYEENKLTFLSKEEYVDLVVRILEYMPPGVVIHRLTGDSPRDLLVGPQWSLKKWEVLNSIDRELVERDTWQGRLSK